MGVIYKIEVSDIGRMKSILPQSSWPYYESKSKIWLAIEWHINALYENQIPFQVLQEIPENPSHLVSDSNALWHLPDEETFLAAKAYAMSRPDWFPNGRLVFLGRNMGEHQTSFQMDKPAGRRRLGWEIQEADSSAKTVQDHFPEISRRFTDSDTKVVVSFAGGGLKSVAHFPLGYFLDSLGRHHIDEIWGTSSGAMSGLWYSTNLPLKEIENYFWGVYHKTYKIDISPSIGRVFGNLFHDFLLPSWFKSRSYTSYIRDSQSLKVYVGELIRDRKTCCPFYAIAYNTDKMRTEILSSETDIPLSMVGIQRTVAPLDAMEASSAIPSLFPPKNIIYEDGESAHYIDGGVSEPVPMYSILKKWEADRKSQREKRSKLLIIAAKTFADALPPLDTPKNLNAFRALRLYESIMLNVATKAQEALVRTNPNVSVVLTDVPLDNIAMNDYRQIPHMDRLAKIHVMRSLEKAEKNLAEQRLVQEKMTVG